MTPHIAEYELPNIISGRCIIYRLRNLGKGQWHR